MLSEPRSEMLEVPCLANQHEAVGHRQSACDLGQKLNQLLSDVFNQVRQKAIVRVLVRAVVTISTNSYN